MDLNVKMVMEINNLLREKGSCLQYIIRKDTKGTEIETYVLCVIDEYIDKSVVLSVVPNKEFEKLIKGFLKEKYGNVNTGFVNNINILLASNNI